MPFAATWMDPEVIILNEVRERQISYDITNIWNLKIMIQMSLFKNRNRLRRRKETYWLPKGMGGRGGEIN